MFVTSVTWKINGLPDKNEWHHTTTLPLEYGNAFYVDRMHVSPYFSGIQNNEQYRICTGLGVRISLSLNLSANSADCMYTIWQCSLKVI